MKQFLKATSVATLLCMAIGANAAAAEATSTGKTMASKGADSNAHPHAYSDRQSMKAYTGDREALQAQLKPGMDMAHYRKQLGDLGYQITAVNDRQADYVEYEVVKGNNSHEVQIDFDKATRKATKVDVAMNLWRADSTKAALRGNKFKPMVTADYSDRAYSKGWADEKEGLEKALGTGHDKKYYAAKLSQLGYTVTATNDQKADYLEYEIVKGNRTYEVQIDFDKSSQQASKVDVTTNLWNADATDKALAANKR